MSLEKALQENTEAVLKLAAVIAASGGKGVAPEADAGEEKETATRTTRSTRGTRNTRSTSKDESTEPKYSAEQVKAAAVKVKDELGTAEAKALIKKHGATELAKLKPEVYDAFVAEAEEMLAGNSDDDGGEDDGL